jgi:carboxymethylenebutenolidase
MGASDHYAAVFDEHMADEFQIRSPEKTMDTMTAEPVVIHVPTSTGGHGHDDVFRFYRDFFIGTFPDDFAVEPLSRTIGDRQLVDEMIVRFTHDREVPIFLPGVAPTGRPIEVALVAVVGFEDDKVASEHLYWDQATVLVQAGLIDPAVVPALGIEQADALAGRRPTNQLLSDW